MQADRRQRLLLRRVRKIVTRLLVYFQAMDVTLVIVIYSIILK